MIYEEGAMTPVTPFYVKVFTPGETNPTPTNRVLYMSFQNCRYDKTYTPPNRVVYMTFFLCDKTYTPTNRVVYMSFQNCRYDKTYTPPNRVVYMSFLCVTRPIHPPTGLFICPSLCTPQQGCLYDLPPV